LTLLPGNANLLIGAPTVSYALRGRRSSVKLLSSRSRFIRIEILGMAAA
jgi:hypothetical protein